MKNALTAVALLATLAFAGASQAGGPVTKQNGSKSVIEKFTPICAVPGYANYGLCGGSTTTFSGVGGKMNAVQPKPGIYNLDFSFSGLTPGTEYRLWSTRDAHLWVEVGRMVANEAGSVAYSMQTTSPLGLGFDLNTIIGDITIVTSWWSGQKLVVNADTTLSTAV
ncbi:MAG TPA: hypothetical protein VEW11_06770 [Gaiellaceae bacterium]|nr:hypothetical protein [Gaiellaceae bacterium]